MENDNAHDSFANMMTSKSVEKTLDTFQCMFNEIKAIPLQLEKLQSENLQLSKDVDKLKDANRNAAAHKHKLKETQAEVEELRMEKDMLQEKVDYLNKQAEELKKNRQKARGETSEFGDRRYQEHQLKEQLNEANTQIHDIQHELDETKLRTTKLDERYSELYDNQWTDAFDVFEKQGMTEEEVIRLLLKILRDVYDFCQTKSLEQIQSIKQAMLIKDTRSGREIPSLRLKKYLDCRKDVGEESGKAVLELIICIETEINQYGSARATGFNESSRNHAYHFESSYLGYIQSNDDIDRSNLGGQSPTRRSNMYGITDRDMDDFFFYRKRWSDDHDMARSHMGKERYDRCREYYYKTCVKLAHPSETDSQLDNIAGVSSSATFSSKLKTTCRADLSINSTSKVPKSECHEYALLALNVDGRPVSSTLEVCYFNVELKDGSEWHSKTQFQMPSRLMLCALMMKKNEIYDKS
ncbi:hypothetical protein MAR_024006 [Mya arenaria]|uniref:Uncharacterized protein n=1 Tax=Mya arenaria TaxID=6604 RepID=A0ABY7DRA2_MYAAR|nr:hypothetical protein MAR_024006 [Mya arenaria]